MYDAINEHPDAPNLDPLPVTTMDKAIIEFHAIACAVTESIGQFAVTIIRHGKLDNTVAVRYNQRLISY